MTRYILTGAVAYMSATAVPYVFSPNTPARSTEVNSNFSALDTRVSALEVGGGGTPAKVSTPENDIAQLEDGTTPAGNGVCNGSGCVYRLTAGPFVLTNVEQENTNAPGAPCGGPCYYTYVGRILFFPAPSDADALAYATNTGSFRPRWTFRSVSYSTYTNDPTPFTDRWTEQTGIVLRKIVRNGEYLYSTHLPESAPPVAGTDPDHFFVSATGYWSGFRPY